MESIRPSGWAWAKLGDICQAPQYGWTTSAANEGNLHLLRTTDITSGTIEWDTVPFCREEPADIEKYLLEHGDIVISRAGSVGYSHLITNPKRSIFASYLIRFKPLINDKYIYYFLKSPDYWNAISERSIGIAIPNVNATKLKEILIPLPPLPEQHRIVARIEELFSHLDAGVEALQKAKAQLKRYRQAVLKAAVEGKLTEEWRKQHPEVEAARRTIAGIVIDSFAAIEPYQIPNSWTWTVFSSLLAEPLRNGHSAKASDNGLGIRTLTLSAVTERDFSEKNTKITVADARRVKNLWLRKNDILIERSNTIDYVGLSAIYLGEDNYSIYPDLLIRARVSESLVLPIFAEIVLRTPLSRDFFKRNAQGISGNMPKIDQGTINRLPFPLPPLGEQYWIINEFEQKITIVEEIDMVIQSKLALANHLRHSILKRAFEGKLVPQDPSDEPASVLLERIIAESTKESPRRGRKRSNRTR